MFITRRAARQGVPSAAGRLCPRPGGRTRQRGRAPEPAGRIRAGSVPSLFSCRRMACSAIRGMRWHPERALMASASLREETPCPGTPGAHTPCLPRWGKSPCVRRRAFPLRSQATAPDAQRNGDADAAMRDLLARSRQAGLPQRIYLQAVCGSRQPASHGYVSDREHPGRPALRGPRGHGGDLIGELLKGRGRLGGEVQVEKESRIPEFPDVRQTLEAAGVAAQRVERFRCACAAP